MLSGHSHSSLSLFRCDDFLLIDEFALTIIEWNFLFCQVHLNQPSLSPTPGLLANQVYTVSVPKDLATILIMLIMRMSILARIKILALLGCLSSLPFGISSGAIHWPVILRYSSIWKVDLLMAINFMFHLWFLLLQIPAVRTYRPCLLISWQNRDLNCALERCPPSLSCTLLTLLMSFTAIVDANRIWSVHRNADLCIESLIMMVLTNHLDIILVLLLSVYHVQVPSNVPLDSLYYSLRILSQRMIFSIVQSWIVTD